MIFQYVSVLRILLNLCILGLFQILMGNNVALSIRMDSYCIYFVIIELLMFYFKLN